jgi:hypothetical protein
MWTPTTQRQHSRFVSQNQIDLTDLIAHAGGLSVARVAE